MGVCVNPSIEVRSREPLFVANILGCFRPTLSVPMSQVLEPRLPREWYRTCFGLAVVSFFFVRRWRKQISKNRGGQNSYCESPRQET